MPDPNPVFAGDCHGSHILVTIQINDVITGRNHIKEGLMERLFDKQPDYRCEHITLVLDTFIEGCKLLL